jgi:hypothetical protein
VYRTAPSAAMSHPALTAELPEPFGALQASSLRSLLRDPGPRLRPRARVPHALYGFLPISARDLRSSVRDKHLWPSAGNPRRYKPKAAAWRQCRQHQIIHQVPCSAAQ